MTTTRLTAILLLGIALAKPSLAEIQSVSVPIIYSNTDSLTLPVMYSNDLNNTALSGLGLRIHWDSSKLSDIRLDNVLSNALLQTGAPEMDAEDLDNDPETDMSMLLAWASLSLNWPGENLPLKLYDATFTINPELPSNTQTQVNFSAASLMAGYSFQGEPAEITLTPYTSLTEELLAELQQILLAQYNIVLTQNAQTEQLEFRYDGSHFSLAATEVTFVGNRDAAEVTLNQDGNFQIITETGYQITVSASVIAPDAFAASLARFGLAAAGQLTDAIKVYFLDNTQTDYFSIKADIIASPYAADAEAILSDAHPVLAEQIVFYWLANINDTLHKQKLRAHPDNWTALKAWLINNGLQNVALDGESLIHAESSSSIYQAVMDYKVTPGEPTASGIVEFVATGDLNNDGQDDFQVIYPNGAKQYLYLYPVINK